MTHSRPEQQKNYILSILNGVEAKEIMNGLWMCRNRKQQRWSLIYGLGHGRQKMGIENLSYDS